MFGQVVHRIQRNQNHVFSNAYRAGDRFNPFQNTLTVLEDPKNERKLYLIGSTHSSTLLAQRTRDLIRDVKPDAVFVQTNEEWWNKAKYIKEVHSQKELNRYHNTLRGAYNWEVEHGVRNFRNLVFWIRFYLWLGQATLIKSYKTDFHPFLPGLEVKYAIEEAINVNANVVFGGLAITNDDLLALKTETRMDVFASAWRYTKMMNQIRWQREKYDFDQTLSVRGGEAFAESFDKYRAAWVSKAFEKIFPHQKKILFDKKDEDLFLTLHNKIPGKTIVAVVNQWHTEGIENYWRFATNTQIAEEPINPIGDMDLEEFFENNLIGDYLRKFTSRLTRSEPATSRNLITQYYKDLFEYERFRHVDFRSHDDPHMYHDSPYDGGYRHHHPQLPKEVREKIEHEWKQKFDHGHH